MSESKSRKKEADEESCYLKLTNPLQNWSEWVERRKEFHEQAGKRLGRKPADMILNKDSFPKIQQERVLFKKAIIDTEYKPDLKKKDDLEHVAVPEYILQEKGTPKTGEKRKDGWDRSLYKQMRAIQLQESIQRLQSHKPETDELIIVGSKIEEPPPKIIEDILSCQRCYCESSSSDSATKTVSIEEKPQGVLKIDDHVYSNWDETQESIKRFISFDYDIIQKEKTSTLIEFSNIGNIVLKYRWIRIFDEPLNVTFLPVRNPMYSFIFKKSDDILLPGQAETLKITFATTVTGIHRETWEIRTEPTVFKGGFYRLDLLAVVTRSDCAIIAKEIDMKLEEGVKYRIIEYTIEDILEMTFDWADCRSHFIPTWCFGEADLFEAVNSKDLDYPKGVSYYEYNEDIVDEMKKIYDLIRKPADIFNWNLDVTDLHNRVFYGLKKRHPIYKHFFSLYNSLEERIDLETREQQKYDYIYNLLSDFIDGMTDMIEPIRAKYLYYLDINSLSKFSLLKSGGSLGRSKGSQLDGISGSKTKGISQRCSFSGPFCGGPCLVEPRPDCTEEERRTCTNPTGKKRKLQKRCSFSGPFCGGPCLDGPRQNSTDEERRTCTNTSFTDTNASRDSQKKKKRKGPRFSTKACLEVPFGELPDKAELDALNLRARIEAINKYNENLYYSYLHIMTRKYLDMVIDEIDTYLAYVEPYNEGPRRTIRLIHPDYFTKRIINQPTNSTTSILSLLAEHSEIMREITDLDNCSVYASREMIPIYSHYPVAKNFTESGTGSNHKIRPDKTQLKEIQTDDIPIEELVDIEAIIENEIKCTSKHMLDETDSDNKAHSKT